MDRYGKKYAWIAYFELYGLRDDRGLLKGRWGWTDVRPSDVDIEPSFPINPRRIDFVADFLGGRSKAISEWIEGDFEEPLSQYMNMDSLGDQAGPWVLLNGYFSQEDATTHREFFSGFDTLMIKRRDLKQFLQLRAKQPQRFRTPESHYTFLGEVPWADTFDGGECELAFQVGARRRKRFVQAPIELAIASLRGQGSRSRKLEFASDEPITQLIHGLNPAYAVAWESYHTETSPGETRLVPAKEISQALGLWVRLPRPNMFEPDGRCASVTVRTESGQFCFLRKDLADQYLEQNDFVLVYEVTAQRRIHWKRGEAPDFAKYPVRYKDFWYSYVYDGAVLERILG